MHTQYGLLAFDMVLCKGMQLWAGWFHTLSCNLAAPGFPQAPRRWRFCVQHLGRVCRTPRPSVLLARRACMAAAAMQLRYLCAQTWAPAQDFLPVFAAGNEGLSGNASALGARTVTSPATAKNCVTVGATLGSGQALGPADGSVTTHAAAASVASGQGQQALRSFQVGVVTSVPGRAAQRTAAGGPVASMQAKEQQSLATGASGTWRTLHVSAAAQECVSPDGPMAAPGWSQFQGRGAEPSHARSLRQT